MKRSSIKIINIFEIFLLMVLLTLLLIQAFNFVPNYRVASWSFEYSQDQATDPALVIRAVEPFLTLDPYYAKKYYNTASRQIGEVYALGKLYNVEDCEPYTSKRKEENRAYISKNSNRLEAKEWLKCRNYLCEDGENEYLLSKKFSYYGLNEEANYWMNVSKSYRYEKAINFVTEE